MRGKLIADPGREYLERGLLTVSANGKVLADRTAATFLAGDENRSRLIDGKPGVKSAGSA